MQPHFVTILDLHKVRNTVINFLQFTMYFYGLFHHAVISSRCGTIRAKSEFEWY